MKLVAMLATAMMAIIALADTVNFDNLKTGAPPPRMDSHQDGHRPGEVDH
jgi:hypothetical protein